MGSTVADKIRIRRQATGLNQADFAYLAGIPARSYQDYEGGKRPIPSHRLILIARALKCSLTDLDPSAHPEPESRPSDLSPGEASILDRLKHMEDRFLKVGDPLVSSAPKQDAEVIPLGSDTKAVVAAWNAGGSVSRPVAIYFLTGKDEDLRKVHKAIQNEVRLVRKHLIRLQAAGSSRKGP